MVNEVTCQTIKDITLSNEGKKSLKAITEKIKLGKYLKPIMLGGVLFNTVVHDRAIPQIFTVTSTDWLAVAQAMKSLDTITKEAVRMEIKLMIIASKGKEKTFWRSMNECY